MYKLALSFIGRIVAIIGGKSGWLRLIGMALACALPLTILQCSQSSLAELREDHKALQVEYAALAASLTRCREAASLHNLALMEREREIEKINNKYTKLREDFLHGLLVEDDNDSPKIPAQGHHVPSAAFKAWCAQPLPLPVRQLFAAGANALAAHLPAAPGHLPYGDAPAANPKP